MLENYIECKDRKRILLIADDMRAASGVGNMSREIMLGTAHNINWLHIASGINHPDEGKCLNISPAIDDEIGINDSELIIFPRSDYGTIEFIRQLMGQYKIDAIMLFTDPRYFQHIFLHSDEIRSKIPIIYYNIWDNGPLCLYNKSFYESCDALFPISKLTMDMNIGVLEHGNIPYKII